MNGRLRSFRNLSTCSTCGGTVPDADYHDPDGAENVTGAALCRCRPRRLTLPGDKR